jgi:hypothetical protein
MISSFAFDGIANGVGAVGSGRGLRLGLLRVLDSDPESECEKGEHEIGRR